MGKNVRRISEKMIKGKKPIKQYEKEKGREVRRSVRINSATYKMANKRFTIPLELFGAKTDRGAAQATLILGEELHAPAAGKKEGGNGDVDGHGRLGFRFAVAAKSGKFERRTREVEASIEDLPTPITPPRKNSDFNSALARLLSERFVRSKLRHKVIPQATASAARINRVLEFGPEEEDKKNKEKNEKEKIEMSQKRSYNSEDREAEEKHEVALVPQSQWVYNTPDKRNFLFEKKVIFEASNENKFVPAVIYQSDKNKILYDIKKEIKFKLNDEEKVPIDRRFLKPICENTIEDFNRTKKIKFDSTSQKQPNFFNFNSTTITSNPNPNTNSNSNSNSEYNLFLSDNTKEESIDINLENENSKLSDPYERAPLDYRHQLLMATQRPCKTVRRASKRHLLKAKSLSFDSTPPRPASDRKYEPRRLNLENYEEFEAEFNVLKESEKENPKAGRGSEDGGFGTFKFYPRRNFDFKP